MKHLSRIISSLKVLRARVPYFKAQTWNLISRFQLFARKYRLGKRGIYVMCLALIILTIFMLPAFQLTLATIYPVGAELGELENLLLGLGTALIGATAVITSLVMFAMQVNIERMPHGLFRRLSMDKQLLGSFAIAFLLAITVSLLSTAIGYQVLAEVAVASFWSTVIIILLFMFAYGRALVLINPLKQLQILVDDVKKDMDGWSRRASRAAPFFKEKGDDSEVATDQSAVALAAYFQVNNFWIANAVRAIKHGMSFARQYAEQGDYEVSGNALSAIFVINAKYIQVKGKSFYGSVPFADNPLATDAFINTSLESLRKHLKQGLARSDEQQVEQALICLKKLANLYLQIGYVSPSMSKTHARLASAYLQHGIEDVVPHGMIDVLMEGQRLMGDIAVNFLTADQAEAVVALSEKIALIACTGSANEKYRPVTAQGIKQLSILTQQLLLTDSGQTHYMVVKAREHIQLVARSFLDTTGSPILSMHSSYLESYFSAISSQSFQVFLTNLVNSISSGQIDEDRAKKIIRNIETWADGIYAPSKELLLASVQKKLHFTFDMIYWTCGMTEVLSVVAKLDLCDEHLQSKLLNHARWLISILDWIPGDREATSFVENYQLTDKLFESGLNARKRGCETLAVSIQKLLLSWTFKAGKNNIGWGTLERGLLGSAVLAINAGSENVNSLYQSITHAINSENPPSKDDCDRAAAGLIETAQNIPNTNYHHNEIEAETSLLPVSELAPVLVEIARLLRDQAECEPRS